MGHHESNARKWQMEILAVRQAGGEFAWIDLAAPADWQCQPGQFLNVLCSETELQREGRELDYTDDDPWPQLAQGELVSLQPLVRRPLSISDCYTDSNGQKHVVLLVRVVGPGSLYMSKRMPGDVLDIIGPIGNGFDLDACRGKAYLIGGGCGVAPLVGLSRSLAERGCRPTIFYGAASEHYLPLTLPITAGPSGTQVIRLSPIDELHPNVDLVVATENGRLGFKGLVTEAMMAAGDAEGWSDVAIYACGPDAMMAAVAAIALSRDVKRCQVSLEMFMGCATGMCLSCAVKIRSTDERGWTNRFVCQDGPVFEARDVIFEGKWEGCKQ